jgi:pimeloyl-ACP methyl ester carboxylesterase
MQLTLPDGRSLDVVLSGDSGPAIVFHHGTPSAAESSPDWIAAAADAGFRWVSYTRAGYGGSTRRPGRSVADNCSDVTALLDELGIETFLSMGWSGGGPHALACGALLAPRCAGVALLAGVAPFAGAAEAGLDWYAGMGPENHEEFGAAVEGEAAIRAYLEPLRPQFTGITGPDVADSLGGLVDAPDRAVLTGEFADHMAAELREAVRVGVDGWLDDDLAFSRDWGFALRDVQVPVSLWQGQDDRMVPYAHGEFLAEHLPNARAHLLAGEGHLSIALGRFRDVVAEVRTFV